jgi:hypothetical protein
LGAQYVRTRVKTWTQGSDDRRDGKQGFGHQQQLFPEVVIVVVCIISLTLLWLFLPFFFFVSPTDDE